MSSKSPESLLATIQLARDMCRENTVQPESAGNTPGSYERLLRFIIQGNQHDKV